MSIRNIIRAALAAVARFAVVTTKVVVNGVRQLVTMLVPRRNEALNDIAEEYLDEGNPAATTQAVEEAKAIRTNMPMSENDRVRWAAFDLREGRQISPRLLDPTKLAETEILEWLAGLGELQLGYVVRASDADLTTHLDGEKKLRCPLLPAAQTRADAKDTERQPLDEHAWKQELVRLAAEDEDDDLSEEKWAEIEEEAKLLAEGGCSISDYPKTNVTIRLDFSDEYVG